MGRPAYKATEQQRQWVKDLAFAGETKENIARLLKCDVKTLKRNYADELGLCEAMKTAFNEETRARLQKKTQAKYEEMLDSKDCAPAIVIFGLKALCGWKETIVQENVAREWDDISDEVLERIIAGRARMRRTAKAQKAGSQAADPVRRVHQA